MSSTKKRNLDAKLIGAQRAAQNVRDPKSSKWDNVADEICTCFLHPSHEFASNYQWSRMQLVVKMQLEGTPTLQGT
jgi:hypothetical protein